jgi:hypothetical protein
MAKIIMNINNIAIIWRLIGEIIIKVISSNWSRISKNK